eukprot:4584897-Prymnesium_polylepis.2
MSNAVASLSARSDAPLEVSHVASSTEPSAPRLASMSSDANYGARGRAGEGGEREEWCWCCGARVALTRAESARCVKHAVCARGAPAGARCASAPARRTTSRRSRPRSARPSLAAKSVSRSPSVRSARTATARWPASGGASLAGAALPHRAARSGRPRARGGRAWCRPRYAQPSRLRSASQAQRGRLARPAPAPCTSGRPRETDAASAGLARLQAWQAA